MKNLYKWSFLHALGILVYISIIATLMQNGDRLFGQVDNFIGPIAFLLLFTLSAVIVGGLVIGKPIMLYLDNKKKEAISMLLATAAWLAGFTVLALIIGVIIKN